MHQPHHGTLLHPEACSSEPVPATACVWWCLAERNGRALLPVQMAHNYQRQDELFHRILHLPVALAAVSEAVHAILAQQVGGAQSHEHPDS